EFAHVEYWADVRVMEGGGGAGLAVEAFLSFVAVVAQERDFQGHLAVELGVVGLEDRPHAALAQALADPIAPELARDFVWPAARSGRPVETVLRCRRHGVGEGRIWPW